MLQKPHALGGFGLTPNVLAQIAVKVAMVSRFLKLVGSLPPEEQQLWLPNQTAQDPDSWHAPHLLNLKTKICRQSRQLQRQTKFNPTLVCLHVLVCVYDENISTLIW